MANLTKRELSRKADVNRKRLRRERAKLVEERANAVGARRAELANRIASIEADIESLKYDRKTGTYSGLVGNATGQKAINQASKSLNRIERETAQRRIAPTEVKATKILNAQTKAVSGKSAFYAATKSLWAGKVPTVGGKISQAQINDTIVKEFNKKLTPEKAKELGIKYPVETALEVKEIIEGQTGIDFESQTKEDVKLDKYRDLSAVAANFVSSITM